MRSGVDELSQRRPVQGFTRRSLAPKSPLRNPWRAVLLAPARALSALSLSPCSVWGEGETPSNRVIVRGRLLRKGRRHLCMQLESRLVSAIKTRLITLIR
ncbi:Hypothetical protein NTJ_10780 [Nesidiocoris tenuis]|uniref:Uncharacterized protein n=1 Tax=Nesidiocoris tenuis TaxID=355587 RepID=A0ABN7B451_9HEMI|nr:Hypothetical protein NTJ_10780 [Nesidiocoris tenuis]